MTRRRRKADVATIGGPFQPANTPSQEDDADILAEADAEPDEESGDLVADEESVRQLGAVDAASVRENRRLKEVVNKKRANVKNVSFNTGDTLTTYDTLIKYYPPNTMDITVRRLTGTPVQTVITSRPRSGAELHTALMVFHGQNTESEYEVKFVDIARREFRGTTKITLPDTTRGTGQGSPMSYPYGAPPPGYPPGAQAAQGYPSLYGTPPLAPAAVSQPPPFVAPPQPAAPDMGSMLGSVSQMFEMFRTMQQQAAPPVPPPQQQAPMQFMPPPMPAPGADMPAMMQWMQQVFEMFRSMQPQASGAPPIAPPQTQPGPAGGPNAMPPFPPPAGTMFIPGLGYAPIERVMQLFAAPPGPTMGGAQMRRPMYTRDDGPRYRDEEPRYQRERQPEPRAMQTPAEQFREAITVVRTAVQAAEEFRQMVPGASDQESSGGFIPGVDPNDDDSPVSLVDAGPAKLVINKKDGSLRKWETAWANSSGILKWLGEQREAIQKAQNQRPPAPAPQPARVLPPGYVEVTPDYRPPPGYVAIPVQDPIAPYEQPLQPPPSQMPPPVQAQPQPPQQPVQAPSAWGASVPTYEE